MSTATSKDISLIKDEEILRKMWQDTEDFGQKKEIRSHMYKLREQRLREFYNSGDIGSEMYTTGKTSEKTTHADSLIDHSFMSLKDKEIRDSESPTRDISYKVTGGHDDHGWHITSSKEISDGGNTVVSTKLATTAGTTKTDNGNIAFSAKNQQTSKISQTGDDKNFTKSMGSQSSSVLRQEAVSGDQNNFHSSSMTSSNSSSSMVISKSSTVDQQDSVHSETAEVVADDDLGHDTRYIGGNTKVTRETKTLPDGTVVTTTRYDTRGPSLSSKNEKVTSSESSYKSESSKIEGHSSEQKSTNYREVQDSRREQVVSDHHDNSTKRTVKKDLSRDIEKEKLITESKAASNDGRTSKNIHTTTRTVVVEQTTNDQEKPVENSYKTTYNTDYSPRKISVEVSPTHEAFARSLRSVSPEALRTSTSSLLSNSSTQRKKHSIRSSSENQVLRRSESPDKTHSRKSYSRSPSPRTKKTYYVENVHDVVTDLDEDITVCTVTKNERRPTSLMLTQTTRGVAKHSPTSPVKTPKSPSKEQAKRHSLVSPTKEDVRKVAERSQTSPVKSPSKGTATTKICSPENRTLKRTDTYEERCRQILGLAENTERRSSLKKRSSFNRRGSDTSSVVDNDRHVGQIQVVVQVSRKAGESPEKKPQAQNVKDLGVDEQDSVRLPERKPSQTLKSSGVERTETVETIRKETESKPSKKFDDGVQTTKTDKELTTPSRSTERKPYQTQVDVEISNSEIEKKESELTLRKDQYSRSPERKIPEPQTPGDAEGKHEKYLSKSQVDQQTTKTFIVEEKKDSEIQTKRHEETPKSPERKPSQSRVDYQTVKKYNIEDRRESIEKVRKDSTQLRSPERKPKETSESQSQKKIHVERKDSVQTTKRTEVSESPERKSSRPKVEYQTTKRFDVEEKKESVEELKHDRSPLRSPERKPTGSFEPHKKNTQVVTEYSTETMKTDEKTSKSPERKPSQSRVDYQTVKKYNIEDRRESIEKVRKDSTQLRSPERKPKETSESQSQKKIHVERKDSVQTRKRTEVSESPERKSSRPKVDYQTTKRFDVEERKESVEELKHDRSPTRSPERKPTGSFEPHKKNTQVVTEYSTETIRTHEKTSESPERKPSQSRVDYQTVKKYNIEDRRESIEKVRKDSTQLRSPERKPKETSESQSQKKIHVERKDSVQTTKRTEVSESPERKSSRPKVEYQTTKRFDVEEKKESVEELKHDRSPLRSPERKPTGSFEPHKKNTQVVTEYSTETMRTHEKTSKSPERKPSQSRVDYQTVKKYNIEDRRQSIEKVRKDSTQLGSPERKPKETSEPQSQKKIHVERKDSVQTTKRTEVSESPERKSSRPKVEYQTTKRFDVQERKESVEELKYDRSPTRSPERKPTGSFEPHKKNTQVVTKYSTETMKIDGKTSKSPERKPSQSRVDYQTVKKYNIEDRRESIEKVRKDSTQLKSPERKPKETSESQSQKKIQIERKDSVQTTKRTEMAKSPERPKVEYQTTKKFDIEERDQSVETIRRDSTLINRSTEKKPVNSHVEPSSPKKTQVERKYTVQTTERNEESPETSPYQSTTKSEKQESLNITRNKTDSKTLRSPEKEPIDEESPTLRTETRVTKKTDEERKETVRITGNDTKFNTVTEARKKVDDGKKPSKPETPKNLDAEEESDTELNKEDLEISYIIQTHGSDVISNDKKPEPEERVSLQDLDRKNFIGTSSITLLEDTTNVQEKPTLKGPASSTRKPAKKIESPQGVKRIPVRETNVKKTGEQIKTNTKLTKTNATPLESRVSVEEPLMLRKSVSLLGKEQGIKNPRVAKEATKKFLDENRAVEKAPTKRVDSRKYLTKDFINIESGKNKPNGVPSRPKMTELKTKQVTNRTVDDKLNKTKKTEINITVKNVAEKPKYKPTYHTTRNINVSNGTSPTPLKTTKSNISIQKNLTNGTPRSHLKKPQTTQIATSTLQTKQSKDSKFKTIVQRVAIATDQSKAQKTVETIKNKTNTSRSISSSRVPLGPQKQATNRKPTNSPLVTKTAVTKPKQAGEEIVDDSEDDMSATEDFELVRTGETKVNNSSEVVDGTETYKPKKYAKRLDKTCITTKTVIITDAVSKLPHEIVDFQRSTSSREPTPDRLCPVPLSSDEEQYEKPRYPDQVLEPDEIIPIKPKDKLSHVPILESESLDQFTRITEINEKNKITEIDRVEETDDSLLTIDEKINMFTKSKNPKKPSRPAMKVQRPELEVSEELRSDECLLSVTDKVNKFISTAEKLTQQSEYVKPVPKEKEQLSGINVDSYKRTVSLAEIDSKPKEQYRRPSTKDEDDLIEAKDQTRRKSSVTVDLQDIVKMETQSECIQRSESPTRKPSEYPGIDNEKTPDRRPSNEYSSIKTKSQETKLHRTENISIEADTTPKTTRKSSKEEPKTISSPAGRLRSTDSIKKARALFENVAKENVSPRQRDILSRPYVNHKKPATESSDVSITRRILDFSEDKVVSDEIANEKTTFDEVKRSRSPQKKRPIDDVPGRPRGHLNEEDTSQYQSSIETSDVRSEALIVEDSKHIAKEKSKRNSPDNKGIPHYMLPLESSHRDQHDHSESIHVQQTTKENTRSRPRHSSPDNKEIPHYMLPLESSHRDQHDHSESIHVQQTTKETTRGRPSHSSPDNKEIPHYMLPLESSHRDQHDHSESIHVQQTTIETTRGRPSHSSPDNKEIPHYMLPLESSHRDQHDHSESIHVQQTTKETTRSRPRHSSPDNKEIPHYMLPLESSHRDQHDHSESIHVQQTTKETTRSRPRHSSPDNKEIPHYMLPLESSHRDQHDHSESIHVQQTTKETTRGRPSHSSPDNREIPHYMLPLESSHRDQHDHSESIHVQQTTIETTRGRPSHSSPDNKEIPHYMLPLESSHRDQHDHSESIHVQQTTRETTRGRPSHSSPDNKEIPHYMLPLESSHRDQHDHSESIHVQQTTKETTRGRPSHSSPDNKEIPHYMLPLESSHKDQHDHSESIHVQQTMEGTTRGRPSNSSPDNKKIPHYMLPLESSHRDQHDHSESIHVQQTTRETTRGRPSHSSPDNKEIPHYMLPLESSHRDQHDHSESIHVQQTSRETTRGRPRHSSPDNKEIPHYMLPLESSHRDQHDHSESIHVQQTTKETTRSRPRHSSPDNKEIPHYMLPLESSHRDQHDHSESIHVQQTTKETTRGRPSHSSPDNKEIPHYMLPLESSHRDQHDHSESIHVQQTSRETSRGRPSHSSPDNEEIPHYMLPLESSHRDQHDHSESIHVQQTTKETTRGKLSYSSHDNKEIPHYMLPLESSHRDQHDHSESIHVQQTTKETTRGRPSHSSPDNKEIPHYMLPLESSHRDQHDHSESIHVQQTSRETTRGRPRHSSPDNKEIPHYMLPLESSHRDQHDHSESIHVQQTTKETTRSRPRHSSPDNKEIPHYMLPLESSHRDQHEHSESIHVQQTSRETTRGRPRHSSPDNKEIPHYMLPLESSHRDQHDHSESIHVQQTTRETTRGRPSHSSPDNKEIPHYMLPLESSHRDQHDHSESIHVQQTTRETTRGRPSHSSPDNKEIPHYMLPLESSHGDQHEHSESIHVQQTSRETTRGRPRHSSPDNKDIPHYMLPLESSHRDQHDHSESIHVQQTTKGTTRGRPSHNSPDDKEIPHYMLPLEASHTEKRAHTESVHIQKYIKESDESIAKQIHPGDTPHYMFPLESKTRSQSPEKERHIPSEDYKSRSRSQSPNKNITTENKRQPSQDEVPRYSRPQSPQKGKINQHGSAPVDKKKSQVVNEKSSRFGVTLKKVDSTKKVGEATTSTTITAKKNVVSLTDEEIESIFDLIVLEELLQKVSCYETRRKIRNQIRIVKKRVSSETKETSNFRRSPERKPTEKQITNSTNVDDRTKQTVDIIRNQKSPSPERPRSQTSSQSIKTTVKTTDTTDTITSSYGVGPTDENGKPLFGLRALRTRNKIETTSTVTSSNGVGSADGKTTPLFGLRALRAQNRNDSTTKVQGTVVRSEFYSENGSEPVGEVAVTKFSTDPSDLVTADADSEGVSSITMVQKFGYKDTPSLKKVISDSKKQKAETTSSRDDRSSKVTRRNSVKAISQKFIDNAVEISKNEKQTYPKAGLILRSSSFKSTGGGSNEETTSDSNETEVVSTTYTTTTKSVVGDSFLTNKTRVTGIKDVLDRMQATDSQEGDTEDDAAARTLLNKFLGSQVILSGIEGGADSVSPSGTSVRSSTRVTTTVVENGNPTTKTLVFQRPVTEKELENIWDEQTLRLLLEQSTGYEERRIIRTRLRQIMAEQEACTDLVEQASQDQSSSTIDGESLLLPLLQGLLETPEKEQICCDSGTESGEDQRNGLIAEVQNALEKLSTSLITGATDITPERRSSLLELVNKLQAGLATTTPHLDRQLSVGGPARFNRRRNRRNRHTVGVSSEELANARRLMEEIASCEPAGAKLLLQKQSSDSSVSSSSPFNKYGSKVVVNAVAKPFNSSSNASSSVQTPTEPLEDTDNDTVVENEPAEVVLQVNPIYTEPKDGVTFDLDEEARGTRFNTRSKKLKMKRANTIDIPKPLNFYEAEDDSDASETEAQKRKNEYYALRGPIRVANPSVKAAVPVFEPKTQSDQKFLALIGRNNEGTSGEARKLWAGQNNTAVWSSKFGNIRQNFERPAGKSSSAMRFWKTQDDNVSCSSKQYGPTISKESARNLQQMFEEKRRQNQLQQLPVREPPVSRPIPVKNSVPQPINQFSHAPQSAFKPIPKKPQAEPVKIQPIFKQELKADKEKTLFLYSPKPLTTYSCTSEVVSPVNPKPWVTNATDHGGRVSNLVSSKFEAPPPQDHVVRPRRVSRELGVVFHPQQAQPEKTAASYMAPGENSLIKRLSKQYDSKVEDIASSLTPASRKPNHFRSSMQLDQPPKVTVDGCENRAVQIYQHVPGKESSAPPKLQTQVSNESLHEYNAISSRVMSGPVSQQAVTVQQNKPMNRNEHDMRAAFDLKSALQNVSRPTVGASFESKQPLERKTCGIVKPMQQKPAGNVIYNNLALSRRESDRPPPQVSALSKSDSWHQICLANQGMLELRAPKNVVRSKSSHSLAVPQKQFEAGFTKEELSRKKQTVEAYFTGSKAPDVEAIAAKPAKRSINRLKTSEKISAQRSSGLSRSKTLPDMVVPQLLDESNVDKAFEDLFMSIS